MNEVYNVCKKNPLKKRKGKKDLEKPLEPDHQENGDLPPEPEVGPDGKRKKE